MRRLFFEKRSTVGFALSGLYFIGKFDPLDAAVFTFSPFFMKMSRCLLGVVAGLVLAHFSLAQDVPPVDLKQLAATLKEIKTKRSVSEKTLESKLMQDFRTASASNVAAASFYQSALMATQNRDASDVQNLVKSDAVQNAARLHLNYLLLTIQRVGGATTKQLEAPLLAHIAAVVAAGAGDAAIYARRERAQELKDAGYRIPGAKGKTPPGREPLFWEQELITQSVKNSVFVQWYGIATLVAAAKDWEFSPGNPDGMYQSTLLPYYRQNKDPKAIAYWDQKLQDEAQKASASNSAFKIDQFNRVKRPQLLWKRAQDMILIGLRNRGMGEMLEIIKGYPDHSDLPDWIAQLEGLAAGGSVAVPSASTDAGTPQPDAGTPQN